MNIFSDREVSFDKTFVDLDIDLNVRDNKENIRSIIEGKYGWSLEGMNHVVFDFIRTEYDKFVIAKFYKEYQAEDRFLIVVLTHPEAGSGDIKTYEKYLNKMPDDKYPDHIKIITIYELISDFGFSGSILEELNILRDVVEEANGHDPITGKKISPTKIQKAAEFLWEWSEISRKKAKMFKKGIPINFIEQKFRQTQTSLDNYLGT